MNSRFDNFLALPGLICLVILVFLPSLSHGFFCWDDKKVALSVFIQTLDINRIITFFTTFHAGLYHPLTTLSFAIDYRLGHGSPFPYHLTNLILHVTNTCLVYVLVKKFTPVRHLPFIVALLFGIHPMHVEAVAWITARKDLLYTLFFLIGALTYLSYIQKKRLPYYFLALFFFLCSALSKIQAASFPFILVLVDYLFCRNLSSRKVMAEKIPFFLITAALVFINIRAQQSYGYTDFTANYNIPERLVLACYGICLYGIKLVFPYPISVFYPYPFPPSAISAFYFLFPIIVLVSLYGLITYFRKGRRAEVFGILFFLICIVIALMVTGFREYIIADRYTYAASIGMFFFLAITGHALLQKYPVNKWIIHTIVGGYCLCCAFLALQQNQLWHSPMQLFTRALEQYPRSPVILTTLGSIATDSGRYEKAITYLDLSESIDKTKDIPISTGVWYMAN